jgi:hypothetical protein
MTSLKQKATIRAVLSRPGCTHVTNNVTALDVLADRGIAWATVSKDLAVYGRQEDWEDSPEGWPQDPTYG